MGLFDRFRRPTSGGSGPASSGLTRLPGATVPPVCARLEGAMSRRRLRGWNPPLENINALVASGGPRLLARARELVVTNGYAANACEAFASNMVGDGIKPSSLIDDAGGRMVPALAFANAPRMHAGGWAGLRPDEVPAILQRGERVLSRREAAGYGGRGGAPSVNVTIMTRDAESFRQSRTQVAADIARAVSMGRRGL